MTLLCLVIIIVSISTGIFSWLWNITIPDIFKVRPITFWEAFRLLLIGAMLSSGAFIRFNLLGYIPRSLLRIENVGVRLEE